MTLWVVRAGEKGEQEEGVLKNNVVAIGWNELDDLSGYDDFDSLYDYYKSINTGEKHNKPTDYDKSIRLLCGEVWRFLNEIKMGDFVVLPSKKTENIFIGKILGDYEYKQYTDNVKHTRKVEWLKTIKKSSVPTFILSSFNTGLTVFEVKKNDAEDFVKNLVGEKDKFEEGETLVKEFLEKEYHETFVNFQHKALVDENDYKLKIYQNARNELSLPNWNKWIKSPGKILDSLKKATEVDPKNNNLLDVTGKRGPENNSNACLYQIKDVAGFEKILFDFFLGGPSNPKSIGPRFDGLIEFISKNNGKLDWRFLSYLLFLFNSDRYFPIAPQKFDKALKFYNISQKLSYEEKTWNKYTLVLDLVEELGSKLTKKYGSVSNLEVQSYLWELIRAIEEKSLKKRALYVTNNFSWMMSEFQKLVATKGRAFYAIGNWNPASLVPSDYPLHLYLQSKGNIVAVFTINSILDSNEFNKIENKMSYRITQKPGDVDSSSSAFLEITKTDILSETVPIGVLNQFTNNKQVDYFPQRVGYVVDIGIPNKKSSKLTFKDAAIKILKTENQPLHYKEITKRAIQNNLITSEGKTPELSLLRDITEDIRINKENSIFKKKSEGVYYVEKQRNHFLAMGPWSNWDHSLGKKPILWGVKPDASNTNIGVFNQLELGDVVFLYVSRHPPSKFSTYGIFGVGKIVRKCSNEKEPYWPDEIDTGKVVYTHRFEIEPIKIVENDDDLLWFDGLPNVKGLNVIKPDNRGLEPLLSAVTSKWDVTLGETKEKQYLIQNNPDYPVLRKDKIDKFFGINYASGISDYSKNNFIVLISSLAGVYRDKVGEELITYTGKGQKGDQILSGGNLGIVNAKSRGRKLYFLEELEGPTGKRTHDYRYLGEVEYVGHYLEEEPSENRKVIRFLLKRISEPWDLKPLHNLSEKQIESTWNPNVDFNKSNQTIQLPKQIREQFNISEKDKIQIKLDNIPVTNSFTSGYEILIPEDVRKYLKTKQNYSCTLEKINPISLQNINESDFSHKSQLGFENNSKIISFQKVGNDYYFDCYGHVGNFEQDQCTDSLRNLMLPITSKISTFCSEPILRIDEIELKDKLQKIITDASYGISGQKPLVLISILYWLSKNKFKETSLVEYLKNLKKLDSDDELELLVHNSKLFSDYVLVYKLYQSLGLMKFEIDRIGYHIKQSLEMNTNSGRLISDFSKNSLDKLLSVIEPDRAKILLYNLLKDNLDESILTNFWSCLYGDYYALKCPVDIQDEIKNQPDFDPESPTIQINQEIYDKIMSQFSHIYETKSVKDKLKIPTPDELKEGIRSIKQELLIDAKTIEEIVIHLASGRHILLAGPVGTGKTRLSQILPQAFWTENCGYYSDVHTATADWSTYDVIGGLMPKENSDNESFPKYEIEYGCVAKTIMDNYNSEFKRHTSFIESNEIAKEYHGVWLVIDEFNRADIDKAFGPLFTALEYKTLKIPTSKVGKSEKEIPIPSDYRIMGTLNTADKHFLFNLSDALKRRFAYVEITIPSVNDKEEEIFLATQNAIESLRKDVSENENLEEIVKIDRKNIVYKNKEIEEKFRIAYDVLELIRAFKPLGTAILKAMFQTIIISEKMNGSNSLDNALNANIVPQIEDLEKPPLEFLSKIISNNMQNYPSEIDSPEKYKSSFESTLRYLGYEETEIEDYTQKFLNQDFASIKNDFETKYSAKMKQITLESVQNSRFANSIYELINQSEIV